MNKRQDPANETLPCFNWDVRLLSAYGDTGKKLEAVYLVSKRKTSPLLELRVRA